MIKHKKLMLIILAVSFVLIGLLIFARYRLLSPIVDNNKKATTGVVPATFGIKVLEQGTGALVNDREISVVLNMRYSDPITYKTINDTYNRRTSPFIRKVSLLPPYFQQAVLGRKLGTSVRLTLPANLTKEAKELVGSKDEMKNGVLIDIFIINQVKVER